MSVYKRLKLMPEVQSWALWNMDQVGNIDPSTLPISKQLEDDLNGWSDRFDALYKLEEPNFHLDINFASKEEENRFYDEGWKLLSRLNQEMPTIQWWYKDDRFEGLLAEKPIA